MDVNKYKNNVLKHLLKKRTLLNVPLKHFAGEPMPEEMHKELLKSGYSNTAIVRHWGDQIRQEKLNNKKPNQGLPSILHVDETEDNNDS